MSDPRELSVLRLRALWAIETTTTVGYGDSVLMTFAGRFIAAVVMMFAIGFLTVDQAVITSTFVARSRLEQERSYPEASTAEHFRQFDGRLARIEASLSSAWALETLTELPATERFRRLDERLDRIEAALTRPS